MYDNVLARPSANYDAKLESVTQDPENGLITVYYDVNMKNLDYPEYLAVVCQALSDKTLNVYSVSYASDVLDIIDIYYFMEDPFVLEYSSGKVYSTGGDMSKSTLKGYDKDMNEIYSINGNPEPVATVTPSATAVSTIKTPTIAPTKSITIGQENAVKKAKSYIRNSAFSYEDLIHQLEFEGYTHEESVYGADNCGADWYEEAIEQAKSYIRNSAFSYDELIDQLEYEKFTDDQAVYGADNCGADWYEEAVEQAESYLRHSSFSRNGLYDQLEYEGFTADQINYALNIVYK